MAAKSFPFYSSKSDSPDDPVDLPPSPRTSLNDEKNYLADDDLANAVNVALLLDQPLLLTGKPGTGKTELAYSVSAKLGYGKPLKFETKSTSTARDLFYTYDSLSHFRAPKEASQEVRDYITYNALGLAILLANDAPVVSDALPNGFVHGGKRRSVVLIDEIDKAPRDFPNDILNEVEHMYFRVPELKNRSFNALIDMRPILVMTSNSEKHLPDAFLRRCVYHHITFPDKDRLKLICQTRITRLRQSDKLLSDAINLFLKLHYREGLDKEPATGELLNWLVYLLERGINVNDSLRQHEEILKSSLGILAKTDADQDAAKEIVKDWFDQS
jgi:MoxR-like ATPase